MANPQVSGTFNIFTWLKDQQWLFIIAGWYIVYLFNGNNQKKAKKQALEVETALEVLERIRTLTESLNNLMIEADFANELLSGTKCIKLLSINSSNLTILPSNLINMDSRLQEVFTAYFRFQNYHITRFIILSKCSDHISKVSKLSLNTWSLFKKYLFELEMVNNLESVDSTETTIDLLKQKFNEAKKLYNSYCFSSISLSIKLQNTYLSPILGNKIKPRKPPIHKRLFAKITHVFNRGNKSREV